jgi:prenyltransferase beta subunit
MSRPILLVLLVTAGPLLAQTADEKQATVKFLAALQQPDGGFVPAPMDPKSDAAPRSSLRATSAAVRAIKYLGGEVPNKDKALAFVKSCQDAEHRSYTDVPGGKADVVSTAVGMMAIAELQPGAKQEKSVRYLAENARTFEERRLAVAGMEAAGQFAPEVKDWLAEAEKGRNPDGTYGKGPGQARETGGIVAMILRQGGKLSDDHRRAVLAALQAGQRPDGGYGKADSRTSDGEATYRVMRAFHLLKEKPKDVAKLREFMNKCRNADGGYGVTPGQTSTVGGTYYVAVMGYWLEK